MKNTKISSQASQVINFFLLLLLFILLRVWYLSIVKHDFYVLQARKPKLRTIIEKEERATICDRFHIPLALNKVQYNAAICFADIRQIPVVKWEKNQEGKKVRVWKRKAYVESLSRFLAPLLQMDPQAIEDIIYGKACLFPHTPFVLKEDIAEELYYKLKMCEKDWLGICMQRSSKRIYPQGAVGCDVLGYVGAISLSEYLAIAEEHRKLKEYLFSYQNGEAIVLPKGFSSLEEVEKRAIWLSEHAYTIHDVVGKSGAEAFFDEKLRGSFEKKVYEVDSKGNKLKLISEDKDLTCTKPLILSISSELQKEAESLLAEWEFLQDGKNKASVDAPWQRGGAIVVMDPKTGEVLALASYPRFDPNDLVPAQSFEKRCEKNDLITKWLESESYIGEIWDGKRPLQKEYFANNKFCTREVFLDWEQYLRWILPPSSTFTKALKELDTVGKVLEFQKEPHFVLEKEIDQMLFLDLLDLVVDNRCFSPSLIPFVKEQKVAELRAFSQIAAAHLEILRKQVFAYFNEDIFKNWRQTHFKEYLEKKRKKEKEEKKYVRPYTDYLHFEQKKMFQSFWDKNRIKILYSYVMEDPSFLYGNQIIDLRDKQKDFGLESLKEFLLAMKKKDRLSYLQALRPFADLTKPLRAKYPLLRAAEKGQLQKHLAMAFYPYTGFGYGRSQAFRQATPMGSTFKLIPAYAGLMQQYNKQSSDLNPLTLVDDIQYTAVPGSNSQVLGFFENGQPIKRWYNGGRLPRGYPSVGKINLVKAIERSSNMYFSILVSDVLETPSALLDVARMWGISRLTGINLPGEYKGALPEDILYDKTGLYSFAIGQHSLVVTPLQTARVIAAIANGGKLVKPQIVKNEKDQIEAESLPMPKAVHATLLEGMHAVTSGKKGSARPSIIRSAYNSRENLQAFKTLHTEMFGKTGTAEIFYKPTIDAESRPYLKNHVWFTTCTFQEEEPELVVVVYLRFGAAGKYGAPIAAKLIQRWREIQAMH